MPICNPIFVEATTIPDAWFQLLSACYEKGRKYLITKGSFEGTHRLALDDASGFIHYPHERPFAPIMPEGVPAPTDENTIEKYFATELMDSNLAPNEHYRYSQWLNGGRYRAPKGIIFDYSNVHREGFEQKIMNFPIVVPNQVEWVIKHFKEAGFGTEHCFITIGYPESNFAYDIPYNNPNERQTSPCLRGLDFRIIEQNDKHYLLTKVIYRSWDLWGAFCTNMGAFAMLNELIAQELGIEPGPLSFTSKSLHTYEYQSDVLKMRLRKE